SVRWHIPRIGADSPAPQLTGTFQLEPARGSGGSGSGNGSTPPPPRRALQAPPLVTMRLEFKVGMYAASGLRIDALHLHGEAYKPYKGVKVTTKAGQFEIRV
ncbi:AP-3 complex subunit mu-2, partial [Cladochytrium tenue]